MEEKKDWQHFFRNEWQNVRLLRVRERMRKKLSSQYLVKKFKPHISEARLREMVNMLLSLFFFLKQCLSFLKKKFFL